MLSFSVRIAWYNPKLMPTSSAIYLIVKWWFWRIKSRTASTWTSSVDVEGRPLWGSSSTEDLPVLKWLYHSKHCVWLIHSSPKACWSILHVSVAVSRVWSKISHTHVVLPSPSFSLLKKIASQSLHLFTSVADSSLTGSDRVMWQEALCYRRLPLVSATSRSAFRSLV